MRELTSRSDWFHCYFLIVAEIFNATRVFANAALRALQGLKRPRQAFYFKSYVRKIRTLLLPAEQLEYQVLLMTRDKQVGSFFFFFSLSFPFLLLVFLFLVSLSLFSVCFVSFFLVFSPAKCEWHGKVARIKKKKRI